MEYFLRYSIVVVGDLGVGKSSIVERYVNNSFRKEYIHTVGHDLHFKSIKINNEEVDLGIIDLMGKFAKPPSNFYLGAIGVVLVYDITNYKSFKHIYRWYQDVAGYSNFGTVFMLVGNKSDIIMERKVGIEIGEYFAQYHGFLFMETSALMNKNIDEVFQKLTDEIYARDLGKFYLLQNQSVSTVNESSLKNVKPYPKPIVYTKPEPTCCWGMCVKRFKWSWLLGIP